MPFEQFAAHWRPREQLRIKMFYILLALLQEFMVINVSEVRIKRDKEFIPKLLEHSNELPSGDSTTHSARAQNSTCLEPRWRCISIEYLNRLTAADVIKGN